MTESVFDKAYAFSMGAEGKLSNDPHGNRYARRRASDPDQT